MDSACNNGPNLTCQAAVVQAIDNARAAEGVGALSLPSYYDNINEGQQLLVLANLERVDRGLPGFSGLSSELDRMAQAGAQANNDPNGPSDAYWGSNWAGGEASALLADYDWMYDDGPGSPNLDCTTPASSGCWAHRENILGDYGTQPFIGTGVAKVKGVVSLTELFSSTASGGFDYRLPSASSPSSVSFAPNQVPQSPLAKAASPKAVAHKTGGPKAVTPAKKAGAQARVSPGELDVGTKLGVADLVHLTVSSPLPVHASASVTGDGGHWSVTPTCDASQVQPCALKVKFLGLVPGPAQAVVTVKVQGVTDTVHVSVFVHNPIVLGPSVSPQRLIALYRLITL